MKQNWFAGTLGVLSLVMGTAWTQIGVAQAISFSPPPDNAAPRLTTGGASRGSFFVPPLDNASPRRTTGGASRSGFFTPRADSAAPMQETTGGASRTVFSAGQQETVDAMAPSSRRNSYGSTSYAENGLPTASMMAVTPESFYGTTLEAHPTILVYVPASNAQEAIFSLKDEAKELVFQMTVAVPTQGGIIAVEMPESAPELAVDANYQWYVAIKLDNELSPNSPFVDGWVKRIAPSPELAATLGGQDLAEIEALGANGIWYDTAAQLAMLNAAQADEVIAGHWYKLLESVGLEEVATVPIVI